MSIPLLDLHRQYATIQSEADEAICKVLSSGEYIMGANVKAFEKEFAEYCGVKHAVSVGNGTDGLVIALQALKVGPGDEVITTPYSFFATAESISITGAKPVFVDVRPDTYNINEQLIEAAITERTKAILPVHIFGQPAEMESINNLARKYNLKVIEDACQAVGASYKGKKTGALADIGVFSFFPTKNLGCAGDGGMITTDSNDLAAICRALRVHGSGERGRMAYNLLHNASEELEVPAGGDGNTVYDPSKYYNYLIGHNSRLDEIQAALLRIKLKRLDAYNQARREIAAFYSHELENTDYTIPKYPAHTQSVYHLYMLESEHRSRVVQQLAAKGVAAGVYYPVPLHLQKAYRDLAYKPGDMPVAEYLSYRTFAIPCFPEITKEERAYIVTALKECEEL